MEQTKSAINNQLADKGKGRIIVVAMEQDDAEDQVAHGIILIKNFNVFDSGCTYSFIIPRIVKKLGLEILTLSLPFLIMTTKGEPECTTLGIKILLFEIQGETYVWEFIVYRLRDYDVILEMDWLSHNKAFLYCEKMRLLQGQCNSETWVTIR